MEDMTTSQFRTASPPAVVSRLDDASRRRQPSATTRGRVARLIRLPRRRRADVDGTRTRLHAQAPSGPCRASRQSGSLPAVMIAVLSLALGAAHASPAGADVTPARGGPRAGFTMSFPAQPVALDLQLDGPHACAHLDSLFISIAKAQRGRFRFGPRVAGARPRRDGKRLARWCSGTYTASVVLSDEFDPFSRTRLSPRAGSPCTNSTGHRHRRRAEAGRRQAA
jgi:hypothetical protein